MNPSYSVTDLIAFEAEVADRYNKGEFGSGRIHLHSGGEQHLIDVFRSIKPTRLGCRSLEESLSLPTQRREQGRNLP